VIERAKDALPSSDKSKSETKNSHKKGKVFKKAQKAKTDKPRNEYFCSEHEKNGTHATADCFTIKIMPIRLIFPLVLVTRLSGRNSTRKLIS
jgi:hypothetical protein